MEPAETLTEDTAEEGESPVVTLQDSNGLIAECVVAEERWLAVFDDALRQRAAAAIRSCLARAGRDRAEITILLTDDEGMAALNAAHRGKSGPTNVLSFPGDPSAEPDGPAHLGDLAMAWGVVRGEAESLGVGAGDHALHLIVHGALHLLGHDHETGKEAALMERAETEILAGIGVADPHAAEGGAGR